MQFIEGFTDLPEKVALNILFIDFIKPGGPGATDSEAMCVVRCIEGTARLGMAFHCLALQNQLLPATGLLTLTSIEWHGKQVDQLDTAHSGKVIIAGVGAGELVTRDVLDSVLDVRVEE